MKMMNSDEIIKEVRRNREEILARFHGSIAEHHRAIQESQEKFHPRLVTLNPQAPREASAPVEPPSRP